MPLMLAQHDPDRGTLFLLTIFGDDDVASIKEQDPIAISMYAAAMKMPQMRKWTGLPLAAVTFGVTYLDEVDTQKVIELMRAGKQAEAFKFAIRGLKDHPDDGIIMDILNKDNKDLS